MRKTIVPFLFSLLIFHFSNAQPSRKHNLRFDELSKTWDEGIPLGNATLGALIWEKDDQLRFSLDRSDLWDQRPMKGLDGPEFSYHWIVEQVRKKDYKIVQQKLDEPYEKEPAPSKIPGAALMIDTRTWGEIASVELNIATAECIIKWKSGTTLQTYIDANKPLGRIRISNLNKSFEPRIVPPAYQSNTSSGAGSVEGDDLNRLGYKQGTIKNLKNTIVYTQEGWGGFSYQAAFNYRKINNTTIEASWSISSSGKVKPATTDAYTTVSNAASNSYLSDITKHLTWWKTF